MSILTYRPTKKGRRVLALLLKWECKGEGTVNEDNILDECCGTVTRSRLVTNALVRHGLVTYGSWSDETGYDVHLTEAVRQEAQPCKPPRSAG